MAKSDELPCLRLRVELAAEALSTSDEPSGSVLVGEDGAVPAEGRVGRAHAPGTDPAGQRGRTRRIRRGTGAGTG
jgi:hypothetical protein